MLPGNHCGISKITVARWEVITHAFRRGCAYSTWEHSAYIPRGDFLAVQFSLTLLSGRSPIGQPQFTPVTILRVRSCSLVNPHASKRVTAFSRCARAEVRS